jgi:hypothetical protein
MGLDNIQLPGIVVRDLFKDCLVALDAEPAPENISGEAEISFLGKNEKGVCILVKDDTALYLPDNQLNFLMTILNACKLSMADVSLINISKNSKADYLSIANKLYPEQVLLFDVTPADINLPLNFPPYQVQRFNNQVYLAGPSLQVLETDRNEKSKLWTCLKQVFSIK